MYLLKDGKGPFLEFLRNLTPQVLLGSIALVSWVRLDFVRFDPDNWMATLTFYLAAGLLALAVMANAFQFSDKALDAAMDKPFQRAGRRLKGRGVGVWRAVARVLTLVWRRRRLAFVEVATTILVVYGGMFVVLNQAVNGAVSIIRTSSR